MRFWFFAIGSILFLLQCRPLEEGAKVSEVDFNVHIRPILSDRCFSCHGPDKNSRKADLRLDLPEAALRQKLESGGHAFVAGSPGRSEAFQRMLSSDPEQVMPPPESQLLVTDEEKYLIRRWIEQGAEYKEHWAFIPPEKRRLPQVEDSAWCQTDLDYWVLKRLEDAVLKPSAAASKEALIRRVSFDLTGLPPSVEEMDQFLADTSRQAYENLVERLLSSSDYGEHMAVSWMDLARYADTHGYTVDRYRPAWPWRDWVIQAFNDNMPYDQFVSWQIAGDLIENPSNEQRIATGFNRNHSQNAEGGIVNEEFQVEYVADRTQTFATAFLGLTLECARCHDHKYDPLTQKDYYQLFSYFNQVDESGQITFSTKDMPAPTMLLPTDSVESKIQALEEVIQHWQDSLDSFVQAPGQSQGFDSWVQKVSPLTNDSEPDGLVAHFALESGDVAGIPNSVGGGKAGKITDPVTGRLASQAPQVMEGPKGKAWELNGDDALDFPGVGRFSKAVPFSIGMWVKVPAKLGSGVVFHGNKGGIIYNFKGYQVSIEDGHWDIRLAHAFPYNAIHLLSEDSVVTDTWKHIMLTYDGSSVAEGITFFVDGEAIPMQVEQDQLYKDMVFIREGIDTHLKVGARWRTRGFRAGAVDEIVVYDRELSPWEVGYWAGRKYHVNVVSPLSSKQQARIFPFFVAQQSPYQQIQDSLKKYRLAHNILLEDILEVMVVEERESYRPTFLLNRGAYDAPGEEVFPAPPEVLQFSKGKDISNRLDLVEWLFNPDNPLTARVVANRIWQQCFGQGLVKTAEDFGNQGTLPADLALLDHLALFLIDSGWDVKALIRHLVLSAAYQQQASLDELGEIHREKGLFTHGPSSGLGAEMLRDQALKVSGLLSPKIGGPSVKPYQPEGLWRVNTGRYEPDSGSNLYRKSLYTFWKRTVPPPTMNTFDAPSRSYCLVRRQKTQTPLQALTLMNDPQFQEAARVLGQRILEKGVSPDEGITYVFRSFTSRYPSAEEKAVLLEQWKEYKADFMSHPQHMKGWIGAGEYPVPEMLDKPSIAAYTVVNSTIMNLYEAVRR